MTYDEMVCTAAADGISVMEKPLAGNDERILGNRIAIRKDIEATTEKSCALACYRSKYGRQAVMGNYVICFEPCLAVGKI